MGQEVIRNRLGQVEELCVKGNYGRTKGVREGSVGGGTWGEG